MQTKIQAVAVAIMAESDPFECIGNRQPYLMLQLGGGLMSSARLSHLHINGNSVTDGSIALAGNISNVTIGTRER